jgi:CrcB protein
MIAAVAVGGGLGAVCRYLLAGWVGHLVGTGFPWGIMIVNILGSMVMGVLTEAFALAWSAGPQMRAFLTVGILGGFTTFSSFSLDAVLLFNKGEYVAGLAYVLGSVVLSIIGLAGGLAAVRWIYG